MTDINTEKNTASVMASDVDGKRDDIMIEVKGLKKHFDITNSIFAKEKKIVKAVDGVDFYIKKGETFGMVGESGCGKSTVGRTILRLYKPTAGEILLDGENIADLNKRELLPYRKDMQMIFQDPYASLNARMTVKDIIGEPLDIHGLASGQEREDRIHYLLQKVGLNRDHASRYPHEFSGGQRQRIGIARALAVDPRFIICDEPISALDVSIQAQVVNMLADLQEEFGLTYLFIAHDLSMVRYISDRVGVMYLGNLAEVAETEELYNNPLHPYTQALLSAIPLPNPAVAKANKRIKLEGEVPSPINPPAGCKFRTRCPYATERCAVETPQIREVKPEHFVACHIV